MMMMMSIHAKVRHNFTDACFTFTLDLRLSSLDYGASGQTELVKIML